MEFKGILKEKFALQQGEKNGKQWQSRQFRVETLEEIPQVVIFDLFGEKCKFIENIPLEVAITVNYSFRANKSANGVDERWFNKVNAWKVESDYKTNQSQTTTKQPEPENKPEEFKQNEERDELPF